MINGQSTDKKALMYFPRSYRHLHADKKKSLLFLAGFILPCVILFLLFYTEITYQLVFRSVDIFSTMIQRDLLGIAQGEFLPLFGEIYYVEIPSKLPTSSELMLNLVVTLILLLICLAPLNNKKANKPLSIYFTIILLTHLTSIIYFMAVQDQFPYTATVYSEIYMKQQVGIWLSFYIMAGLVIGLLGYGSIVKRIIAYGLIVSYSIVFGSIRYLISMFIVSNGSSLYMAMLFFSLGPMIDFIYLVCLYGIYVNTVINRFSEGEGRLGWNWS